MSIYEFSKNKISEINKTTFSSVGLKERADIQRLLRTQIDIISPNTLVIAEEFSDWEDSKRRIDLLGLDKEANLVVIELKATNSGGHMELQSIRYAAMVSTMSFKKAIEVYGNFLQNIGDKSDPEQTMLEFLELDEIDEESFAKDVKIILVSADFSKELTTSVMWLNERDMDIRCIRMKPYKHEGKVIVDIQRVIPLPEVEGYLVKVNEKAQKERHDRAERGSRRHLRHEFWQELLIISKEKLPLFANISASGDSWISAGGGKAGIHYSFDIRKHDASINFAFEGEKEKNKKAFDILEKNKEKIESAIGSALEWKRYDNLKKSSITKGIIKGGYRSERETWPEIQELMVETMIKFEKAFAPYIHELTVKSKI